jgi:hypothetical protein
MPRDTNNVAFAVGNTATCSATGFFYQLGLAGVVLTNASFAGYCLLIVRYNWSPSRLERTLEKWVQGTIAVYSLGTAVAGIFLTLYNEAKVLCHIHRYPSDCKESWLGGPQGEGEKACIRGDNGMLYQIALNILPLWSVMIYAIVSMFLIFRFVRHTELKSMQHNMRATRSYEMSTLSAGDLRATSKDASNRGTMNLSASSMHSTTSREMRLEMNRQMKKTALVTSQAKWYAGAFLTTYVPVTISLILWATNVVGPQGIGGLLIDLFAYTFLPLQGFMNFLVFARTKDSMHGRVGKQLKTIVDLIVGIFSCICVTWRTGETSRLDSGSSPSPPGSTPSNRDDPPLRRSSSSSSEEPLSSGDEESVHHVTSGVSATASQEEEAPSDDLEYVRASAYLSSTSIASTSIVSA